jgi:hypothetical protein
LLIFILVGIHPVQASIVSGAVTGGGSLTYGGVFVELEVPFTESDPDNTVGNDTFQNPNLYGFNEEQNVVLTEDLTVDDLADGLGGGSGSGIISAGTTIASHYIFFDPQGNRTQLGWVSFDANILAIISSVDNLTASDYLVNPGVTYLSPTLRGLEPADDTVTITGLQTISVDWYAGSPGDYIRVLTEFSPAAAVPVPASVWLFGCALGLLGWMRQKHA